MSRILHILAWFLLFSGVSLPVFAGSLPVTHQLLDLTGHWAGITALILFIFAYVLVIAEEVLHLRKSKPVMVAAGVIWALVGIAYGSAGHGEAVHDAIKHNLLEYGELLLFLIAAMTYINTLEERQVFDALRGWLTSKGFTLKIIFWLTGLLAFWISPIADNLTTALVMAAVVMAVAPDNRKFIALSCINIVIAANAGGAFSPFGDITTLMVWQKGVVDFQHFFALLIPSVVNWLVPALIMSFAVPKGRPPKLKEEITIKQGGLVVVALFVMTITFAVCGHNFLHLPPVIGMMTGLGILKLYGYLMAQHNNRRPPVAGPEYGALDAGLETTREHPLDTFTSMRRLEWDTLLFFYGVILCVGGLGTLGYLGAVSQFLYHDLGATWANVIVGILSAIVDNIPVMFAVLTMYPDMSMGQWLLVTLTAGVGGSLLSIGSAAGVALMGQAKGIYTFAAHLKWVWAIALGYAGSIWVHFLVNRDLFQVTLHP
ncbi:MAG: sodium:proton antiporter [Gammaproteobacteria bacterium]|nr:MAG: sodium:proton antiporter [Gammaproteobacteria bacterium]